MSLSPRLASSAGALRDLWCERFERARPARSFPKFREQRNFTGLYFSATMDAHVGFESWLERDVAMALDFDPHVVAFSSQPFWLFWLQAGDRRQHPPDYFVRLADGTGLVIDVRPDDLIDPRDAEAFAATAAACAQVGWAFRRTAGPEPIMRANLRWLAGYRHRRCDEQGVRGRLVAQFAEPQPMMAGALAAGDPITVLPVLFHLLWRHQLIADLQTSVLGTASLVSLAEEGEWP